MIVAKTFLGVAILSFSFFLFFIDIPITNGQGYQPLTKITPAYDTAVQGNNIPNYINALIRLIAGGATVLAVVVIVYGGFLYATALDNESRVKEGVKHMQDAVLGLLLLLGSYLLLYTINPQLIELNFKITPISVAPGAGTPGGPTTPGTPPPILPRTEGAGLMADESIRTALQALGPYEAVIKQMAERYGVPEERIRAIIVAESSGRANAVSPAGAYGLMQIKPETARQMAVGDSNLMAQIGGPNATPGEIAQRLIQNPALNIELGTRYYDRALNAVGDRTNYDGASVYYNSGRIQGIQPSVEPSCQGQMIWQCAANPGYAETRKYIPNINNAVRIIRGA